MAQQRTRPIPGANNRSSIFFTASHDKRNMLWKAFRKTVLEPHGIHILENTVMDKVPETLLELVEEMCQDLDRHENQASSFREAVAQGRGFGPSPIFPPDVVPPVNGQIGLARCMEPNFDKETLPPHEISLHMPLFELPIPRPGLACGFSDETFSGKELRALPEWMTAVGTYSGYDTGQIQPGQAVHVPFLMFERTYGRARHELEAAMNYCAMDGAAALHALSTLFDQAWPEDDWNRPASPVVFSCTVDDDVGIIHHHWIEDHMTFMAASLCKFDLRDPEHLMHFLAWIEAIEQWAVYFLLPDIKEALSILSGTKVVKALLIPITREEKNEKLKQSMKLAFDKIPWRTARIQGAPLGVTATMRVRSIKPEETAVHDGEPVSSSASVRSSGISTTNSHTTKASATLLSSARTVPGGRSHPSPVPSSYSTAIARTDQFKNNATPWPSSTSSSPGKSQSLERTNIDMLPPSRLDNLPRSNTSPAIPSSDFSTSAVSEAFSKADTVAQSNPSAMPSPAYSTGGSVQMNDAIPRSYTPAVHSPHVSADSMETSPTTYVHENTPRSKTPGSRQQSPLLAIATEFPGVHNHISKTTPATAIRHPLIVPPTVPPKDTTGLAIATEFPGGHNHVSKTTPATVIRHKLPVELPNVTTTTSKTEKEVPISLAVHAVPPQTKAPPPSLINLSISPALTPQPPTAASTTSTFSVQSKRSFSSLRQQKRVRSPATPESAYSTIPTPKNSSILTTASSSSTIRSKISNSLGMIKEHTLSRPKRVRMDNSGPPTPKPGDEPLPTPAYDKRRFQAPANGTNPGQTNAWVEHVLQDRVLVGVEGASGVNQTTSTMTVPVQTGTQTKQILTQPVMPSVGSSNYLPLRNYGGVSGATKSVTVTAGAV